MIPTEARLLRLHVSSAAHWRGRPLYQAIVEEARARNLAGASVFPVELALGTRQRLHDAASEYDACAVPVLVEIVDAPEKLDALLAELAQVVNDHFATVEEVRVVRYSFHEDRPE